MALRLRSPALIWGPAFILAATGATLRFLRPGHPALPAISAALLGLLTLRMGVMVLDWRRGASPGPGSCCRPCWWPKDWDFS